MKQSSGVTGQKIVALLVETSRAYGRGVCRGVAQFTEERPDWVIIYQERNLKQSIPDFLRKYRVDGILMRVDQTSLAREIISLRIPPVDDSESNGPCRLRSTRLLHPSQTPGLYPTRESVERAFAGRPSLQSRLR